MAVLLRRRLLAEAVGTGALVAVVVGSGVMAQRLSPDDVGLQLLQNSFATALGLAALVAWLLPVSGAHLNPVVTLAAAWWERGTGTWRRRDVAATVAAQLVGAVVGTVLAHAMFSGTLDHPLLGTSTTERAGAGLWLGEVVATAGLVALIGSLVRTGRTAWAAPAVGAYIGAAYWWTSSTSFANPAVTLGRAFTDTFAGIAPVDVPAFVLAQLAGGALGAALVAALHPVEPAPAHQPVTTGGRP
jgi:glycerol uptake facilitator-like aquaporin